MATDPLINQRKFLRQTRLAIPLSHREHYDFLINMRIASSGVLLRRPRIASYMAHNGEPNLESTIKTCFDRHIPHYLPSLTKNQQLIFSAYAWGDRIKYNQFNIEEADTYGSLQCKFLSTLLMPLVGFDNQGNRLGAGGGYYDRTLQFSAQTSNKIRPLLIGIAYSCQETEALSPQTWDIPLDAVITEKQTRCFSKRAIALLRT